MEIVYDIIRVVFFLGITCMVVRQLYIETKKEYEKDKNDN
jgi:hypothetical protein